MTDKVKSHRIAHFELQDETFQLLIKMVGMLAYVPPSRGPLGLESQKVSETSLRNLFVITTETSLRSLLLVLLRLVSEAFYLHLLRLVSEFCFLLF